MENLKIRVNSESESKEAQELFVVLGYMVVNNIDCEKGYIVASKNAESPINFDYWHDVKNIVTIQQLRDLVVLKRNSIDDATHEDKNDPEFKYRLIDNHWYAITEGNPVWRKDSIDLNVEPLFIKPIEKTMKEYLIKSGDGKYLLTHHDSIGAIEIPEGAIKATFCNGFLIFWKDNYSWNIDGFNSKKWRENDGFDKYMENYKNTVKILWQRQTHPEELPFIDDEPKIETATGYQLDVVGSNTYGSRGRYDGESDISYRQYLMNFIVGNRTESLNDQYAEIEKVRQSHRTASVIADSALKHIRERAETYDQPTGERSAAKTAKAFNAITGKDITESEVWLLLQLLKDVRQWSREDYHQDSAEDCIAYAALKAESLEGGE